MRFFRSLFNGFTPIEVCLWLGSLALIVGSAFFFGSADYLYVVAALIGATSLIFVSKGNVLGQILTVVFSVFYGVISFSFRYYGEMITYLGMTAPIAVASVVTWLKNPYKDKKNEVTVNRLSAREYALILALGVAVTVAFYFILRALDTANLVVSTVSVLTSFVAVWLTMRRSALYALAYAMNDVVLIVLWTFAALESVEYVSMVVCFVVFFANDLYGFFNWRRLRKRQQAGKWRGKDLAAGNAPLRCKDGAGRLSIPVKFISYIRFRRNSPWRRRRGNLPLPGGTPPRSAGPRMRRIRSS